MKRRLANVSAFSGEGQRERAARPAASSAATPCWPASRAGSQPIALTHFDHGWVHPVPLVSFCRCTRDLGGSQRSPRKRATNSGGLRHAKRNSCERGKLRFDQRFRVRSSTTRWIRQLDAVILPTAHLADVVGTVRSFWHRKKSARGASQAWRRRRVA